MKRLLLFFVAILLSVSLLGCEGNKVGAIDGTQNGTGNAKTSETTPASGKDVEETIRSLIDSFGKKLQMVSLLAPEDILKKSMEENYGDLVEPALLEKWLKDPLNAPGRLTSSPWPDRIDISSIEKVADDEYKVEGEIVEITSAEQEKGGAFAKRPVTLVVKKSDSKWLIHDVTLGSY